MRKCFLYFIVGFIILTLVATAIYISRMLNYDISYEKDRTISLEKSQYHTSGSWWGYNQKKLASIGDTTFSFIYDNSNLEHGNSSETNPFFCHLTMINESQVETFDTVPTNASCNVLADSTRNRVYYIVNEPTGGPNNGGFAFTGPGKIVFYTYVFDQTTQTVTLLSKEILAEESDDGRQRMGTTINEKGQIMISYGSYDAMLNVFVFDPVNSVWTVYHTLSNPDEDFLMYNYSIIKDLTEFYILAIQDTAKNGTSYYQYVKFFGYVNDEWVSHMVVDYRDSSLADDEPNLIEHTEFTLIDDRIHIITRSYALNEIRYFIWENNQLNEHNCDFINKKADWIRMVQVDEEILFIYNYDGILHTNLVIYSLDRDRIVYKDSHFTEKAYFYTHTKEDGTIQIYAICGKDSKYDASKATLYEISKID